VENIVAKMVSSKRQQLLDAALKNFSERSFYGTSVPKIAETAGVAVGTFYKHFDSKEQLVNELYRYWKQEFKKYLTESYPLDQDTRAQFDFIWDQMFNFASHHRAAFQFVEAHFHESYLDEASVAVTQQAYEIGRNFLRMGISKGDINNEDIDLLLSIFFGAFVQFFKGSCGGAITWNESNSAILRKLCWEAICQRP
jgi:AcrR family transcriptional regulator